MDAYDQLVAHLRKFHSAPFLFVGAGFSRRYLGLPNWTQLLEHIAALTDRAYGYYHTGGSGNLPRVAAAIAERFHEIWWTEDAYDDNRNKFGAELTGREAPMKVEVVSYIQRSAKPLPSKGPLAEELNLLRNATIDGAITTNYDGLLEDLFDDFRVFVGQDELLFADPQGIGEIYKIHGSVGRPESIVLTESDYKAFDQRNPYLAAKLLATFIEHPVVFMGYSMSDRNVTDILVSIARVLTTTNLEKLRDRLIFVQWDPDNTVPLFVHTNIAVEGFTIPIVSLTVSNYAEVFKALGQIKRKFPARLLRKLKDHVYDLVNKNDPAGKLYVQDIDASADFSNIDVVLGVGMSKKLASQGYVGLKRFDLLSDVLRAESDYDPTRVVSEALPAILHSAPTANTPIYRYLRAANLLSDDGSLIGIQPVDHRIVERHGRGFSPMETPDQLKHRASTVAKTFTGSISDFFTHNTLQDALMALPELPRTGVNLEELREVLADKFGSDCMRDSVVPTHWAKAICLYDYYAFFNPPKRSGGGTS